MCIENFRYAKIICLNPEIAILKTCNKLPANYCSVSSENISTGHTSQFHFIYKQTLIFSFCLKKEFNNVKNLRYKIL